MRRMRVRLLGCFLFAGFSCRASLALAALFAGALCGMMHVLMLRPEGATSGACCVSLLARGVAAGCSGEQAPLALLLTVGCCFAPAELALTRALLSCLPTRLPQATSPLWTSACLAAPKTSSSGRQRPHVQQRQQQSPAAAPGSSRRQRGSRCGASPSRQRSSGRAATIRSRPAARRTRRSLQRCWRHSSGRWSSAVAACSDPARSDAPPNVSSLHTYCCSAI